MKKILLITTALCAVTFAEPAKAGPLVAAIAGTAQAAFTGGKLLTLGLSLGTGFAALAVDFAVRATLGYALNALSKRSDPISRGYQRNVNQLGTALPHQIIYGETVVGGAVFYQALSDGSTKLHRCIAFAGHEIESYEAIYLDGEEVTLDGSGNVTAPAGYTNTRIKQYLGTSTQTADSDLVSEVSEWTTTHRAQGIAYLYVRFDGASNFQDGIPVVSAKIRGRKVSSFGWEPHNFLTNPGDLTDADWTTTRVSVSGSQTDPDGGSTAFLLTENAFSGEHLLFFEDTITTSNTDYVYAVWAKTNGRHLHLRPRGRGLGSTWANYNLTTGAVGNSGGTDLVSTSIEDFGSGWYLCKMKFTSDVDPTVGMEIQLCTDPATDTEQPSYLGDGSQGIYVWRPHFYRDDDLGMTDNPATGNTYFETTDTGAVDADLERKISLINTTFEDNPAICIRDYLLADFGLSEVADNIDDDLFNAAANSCKPGFGAADRFTCNGAFTLDSSPEDIIRNLLSSMGGTFWNYGGNWAVNAAEYQTPTLTLTVDDLRGPLQVATRHSRRDNFNVVRGQYKGAETEYQPDDYTEVASTFYTQEDNGVRTSTELDLLFTDNQVMAQRIAQTYLRRNRLQITVAGSFGLKALDLKIGDNLFLTVDYLGFDQKVFEVVDWRLGITEEDIQVNMILREMSEEVYTGVLRNITDESLNVLQDESGNNLEAIVT